MKKSNMTLGIVAAAAGIWALLRKKKQNVAGIGAVLWEYAIMECKQLGIDLRKGYFEQPSWVVSELSRMRKKFGYRQSKSSQAMGRSENQSFYYSLQRHAGELEG